MIVIYFWEIAVEIAQSAFRATLEPFKSRCNAKDEGLILDRHFGAPGAKPIRHRQDSEMREISTRDLKSTISFS